MLDPEPLRTCLGRRGARSLASGSDPSLNPTPVLRHHRCTGSRGLRLGGEIDRIRLMSSGQKLRGAPTNEVVLLSDLREQIQITII